jgi:nucleotide-binding universal stress UspA family protein
VFAKKFAQSLDLNQGRRRHFAALVLLQLAGVVAVPIKDILLHLEAKDSAQPTVDFAESLAVKTGAHLTAAGIAIEYPPPGAGPSIGGMGFSGAIALQALEQENRQALEEAGKAFIRGAPAGLQTNVTLIRGYRGEASRAFARLARYFDLSVITQATPNEGSLDQHVVIETLFGSGRPVFIVPYIHKGPARLERVMICWDGGSQGARALAAAMPLLALSREAEIVTIGENREIDEGSDMRIAMHLARHGIRASLTSLPDDRDIGQALLSYAADSGADYIVMGAYGHWRLTELVIGGTTRTILESMTAAVLMAH